MRQIYDKTRNKFITETPEEKIRQALLNYLIEKLKIPPHLIITEFALSQLVKGEKNRVDVIVADPRESDMRKPYILAECKAKNFLAKRKDKNESKAKADEKQISNIETEKQFTWLVSQVNKYLSILRPKFIILALGQELRFFSLGEGGYLPSSNIPMWQG